MRKTIRKTAAIASIVAVIMFGFSFALVPLYNVFCKATGFNNGVRVALAERLALGSDSPPELDRSVKVQFIATNNQNMPWDFYPFTTSITVHPGENTKVIFFARNPTNKTMTVQAIPSFAPREAALHFHKIQCFCFNQQTLMPGASKDMPVIFRVDKNLPKDVQTITLAYTLFDVTPHLQRNAK